MKCSDAALIFWTHIVLEREQNLSRSHCWVYGWGCGGEAQGSNRPPLVQSLRFERVDAVDVRDVKEGLVAGGVGGHLHQDLVQKQRLRTEA